MADFRETKIKTLSEEHSRAFQEAVIAAGGTWHSGGRAVKYLSAKFLFVDADLYLGFEVSDRDYFDSHEYKEIQFSLPTKGHVHAELMQQYAEDAKTHAEPWELWQVKGNDDVWKHCGAHPMWTSSTEYRRKPKTHIVNGVEIPDLRVSPKEGEYYYLSDPMSRILFNAHKFVNNHSDKLWVERGLAYQFTNEGKQAAILHAKAMLGMVQENV